MIALSFANNKDEEGNDVKTPTFKEYIDSLYDDPEKVDPRLPLLTGSKIRITAGEIEEAL